VRCRLNGLEFNFDVWGHGPPLLLLHGFTGSSHAWDDLGHELAHTVRGIAPDLIGHGDSAQPTDASRYTLDWCARDLTALLDMLAIDRVSLLGYSMGGRVALHFALSAPERINLLILESATPGIEDPVERARRAQSDDALADRISSVGVPAFVAEWEQQPLLALQSHVSPSVLQRQHVLRLRNDSNGLANSLRGMGTGQQQPLWSRLAELTLPVELIVGQADQRYCAIAQRMQTLLPNSDLAVIPAAGHTAHLDQPKLFTNHLMTALTKHVTPAPRAMTTN
jgi:2-succinyl-6-hydroxy-2,4-cyclohexadiene-1-carboxylate synthase